MISAPSQSKVPARAHYIHHVAQGLCVMMAFIQGTEKMDSYSDKRTMPGMYAKPVAFPWKKVEGKLQEMCKLIDNYSDEAMDVAENLVKKMGGQ